MRQYNHVLVIIEPKREQQLALKRALQMAKFNPHLKISAVLFVYDFSHDVRILGKQNEINTQKDVEKVALDNLHHIITNTLHQEFSGEHIESLKAKIEAKVVLSHDIASSMLKEANSSHYDLIMKAANHHGILDSLIFTPLDWNLLRNAIIPIVIVKDVIWDKNSSIVVALDFSSSEKQKLNVLLLREAQLLSTLTHCPIHLINSAPVVLPTVMLEVPNYAPELYAQSVLSEHTKRLHNFAHTHHISLDNCHIVEGMPDEVIPKLCKQLNAKTVFIGSYGRKGVAAAMVGNTCEEIVDYINADLFVLNISSLN